MAKGPVGPRLGLLRNQGIIAGSAAARQRIGSRVARSAAGRFQTVKLSPQPHSPLTFGLTNLNASLSPCFWKSSVMPSSIGRSDEHTSELQSLMRISYAVFCL